MTLTSIPRCLLAVLCCLAGEVPVAQTDPAAQALDMAAFDQVVQRCGCSA